MHTPQELLRITLIYGGLGIVVGLIAGLLIGLALAQHYDTMHDKE